MGIDYFRFDFNGTEFRHVNWAVELGKIEQKFLRLLAENGDRIFSRSMPMDWGVWTNGAEYVKENALSVMVKRPVITDGKISTKTNRTEDRDSPLLRGQKLRR